jgi:hypothetical protein
MIYEFARIRKSLGEEPMIYEFARMRKSLGEEPMIYEFARIRKLKIYFIIKTYETNK